MRRAAAPGGDNCRGAGEGLSGLRDARLQHPAIGRPRAPVPRPRLRANFALCSGAGTGMKGRATVEEGSRGGAVSLLFRCLLAFSFSSALGLTAA